MKAVQITRTGGPDVLQQVELPTPDPGPGEVLVRHRAIGLNFIDTYQRTGLYPTALPAVLGREFAGVVEAVGSGVKDLKPEIGSRAVPRRGPMPKPACKLRTGSFACPTASISKPRPRRCSRA